MLNQNDRRTALGISCYRRIAIAMLFVSAACTISPPDNVFRCTDTKCPGGQTCDRDRICRTQPLPAPDAGPDVVNQPQAGTGTGTLDMCGGDCPAEEPVCVNSVCKECAPLKHLDCVGDRPVECTPEGTKQLKDECGGDKPVCNNGICGSLRLRGGLGAAGLLPAAAQGVRLVEHTLTRTGAEQCGDIQGTRVCVHGGLQP